MATQHSTSTSRRGHTTTTTTPNRPLATSLAPKPPCSIHPTAIISDKAIITGVHLVTIGEGCIIHPFAKISSALAPVQIGNNCIISERTTIGLTTTSAVHENATVVIEDNTSIETAALVEARRVGANSIVEVSARIGPRASVGKFCKISAFCNITDELPDYTVVFGEGSRRINETVKARSDIRDLKIKGHLMHVDTLKRLVPSNTTKWLS